MIIGIFFVFLVFLAGILFFWWGYRENQHLVVTRYQIHAKELPLAFYGSKIAFLSDLHNNSFGENNQKLKETLLAEKPDLVLIGGDMLVGKPGASYAVALELVLWIKEHFPMIYGMGNHEYRVRQNTVFYQTLYQEYAEELKKKEIELLDNQRRYWEKDGEHIVIYGLTIGQYYYKRLKIEQMSREYITDCLGKREKGFSILLAHNPVHFSAYAQWGASLVLSGHNHGGVMRLPFLGGVISPNYRLFPKYDVGAFYKGNSTMLLSAGLGSHTLPFRFFNPPELLMIQLQGEKSDLIE